MKWITTACGAVAITAAGMIMAAAALGEPVRPWETYVQMSVLIGWALSTVMWAWLYKPGPDQADVQAARNALGQFGPDQIEAFAMLGWLCATAPAAMIRAVEFMDELRSPPDQDPSWPQP